jgi:hypothetical protein
MRVLVIGGSGYVAGLVLPLMAHRFEFCVFDLKPPAWAEGESGREGEGGDSRPERCDDHSDF